MSNPKGTRRAIAEIRWDNDPGAILWVGNRPVAACWPLISSYFRDLLLPPHRRAEDESVTWTWNEPVNPPALTPAEIKSVRRHLQSELQLFLDNVAGAGRAQGQRGDSHQVNPDQLGATLSEWVQQVVDRPDAEFARYICRTDQGLRLHSWGGPQPSAVRFSDAKGLDLAGHVLVGGMPALHDVLLESGDGEMLAETPSDSLGAFRFPKLTPGKYRLRARSKRGTFPPHGVVVVLNQTSVTDIVLADDAPAAAPSRTRRSARAGSRRVVGIAAAVTCLAMGAGWWAFQGTDKTNTPEPARLAEAKSPLSGPASVAAGDSGRTGVEARAPAVSAIPFNRSTTPAAPVPKGSARPDLSAASDLAKTHESSRAVPRKETSAPGVAAGGPAGGGAPVSSPAGGTSTVTIGSTSAATMSATTSPAVGVSPSAGAPPPAAAVSNVSPQPGSPVASGAVAAATSAHAPSNPPPSAKSTPPPPAGSAAERSADSAPGATQTASASAIASSVTTNPAERSSETQAQAARTEESSSSIPANVRPSPASVEASAATTPTSVSATSTSSESPSRSASAQTNREPNVSTPRSHSANVAGRALMSRLTRTVRVRLSPWRVRLLEDSILPTQPLRAGQVEPVAALRQRILEEQKAKLPATLTQGEVLSGLRVELASTDVTDGLAWRDDQGTLLPGSRLEKGRAEIIWTAANAPKDRPIRLSGANGVVLVEARYEPQTRELVVRTAEEVQAWLRWVVRAVPSDVTRESTAQAVSGKPRFVWRTGTGNPIPPGWHATESTEAAADHYVDLPLGSVFGAVAAQSCALLDHVTGWALVTETRQAADRPLGL